MAENKAIAAPEMYLTDLAGTPKTAECKAPADRRPQNRPDNPGFRSTASPFSRGLQSRAKALGCRDLAAIFAGNVRPGINGLAAKWQKLGELT